MSVADATEADIAVVDAQDDHAVRSDPVGADAVRGLGGHRDPFPRSRIATAASSALISRRARRSRMESRLWGTGVTAVSSSDPASATGVGARAEAKGANQRLDAGPDGRIADPELALHLAEVAA